MTNEEETRADVTRTINLVMQCGYVYKGLSESPSDAIRGCFKQVRTKRFFDIQETGVVRE
jgi:hypothetical protein